jgi:hypothetical protein
MAATHARQSRRMVTWILLGDSTSQEAFLLGGIRPGGRPARRPSCQNGGAQPHDKAVEEIFPAEVSEK